MALGVAWVLDGLEITVASSVAGARGSDGNLTYLRDHAPGECERLGTRAAGAVSDGEP
jgi:hypothetical protein